MDQGLGYWATKRAAISGDRLAIVDRHLRFTYREFNQRCNRLANALRDSGVRPGDRVCSLLQNGHVQLELIFAVAKLGAIFLPINFRLTVPEIEYIIQDSGARTLFFHDEFRHLAEGLQHGVHLDTVVYAGRSNACDQEDEYEALLAAAADDEINASVGQDDVALLMYTSGTTGRPKGAMLTHAAHTWNVFHTTQRLPIHADTVALGVAPMFHIGGTSVIVLPTLFQGGTVVTLPAFDARAVLEATQKEGITGLFCVPSMWQMIVEELEKQPYDLGSVEFLMTGAAPTPLNILKYFQERGLPIYEGFGMTEMAPLVTILDKWDCERKNGSVGYPAFFVDVRVVDEEDRDLGPNQVGEVICRGPNMLKGYWNKPEATAEALRGGWYHSGDLGYLDDEGFLYIVDRKKDMIISGGENVYPAEVEQAIYLHPAVAEVAVIGIPHEKWQEVPAAIIVLKEGQSMTEADLVGHCNDRLARFKVPKTAYFVKELPKSGAGKILKTELRKMYGGYKASDK
ncbi:MAG: o-succinylbenzoate--CoA ligase [Porticoccaceae bacterium]|jgi:fatty-acyl-CoA synthase|nr:o-succinylbenzoate--CoA ligase [Porticoccaceae bacterium]